MRISGWHIDGFGIFADERRTGLGEGLTVFCGANEAGKSTLLAFIRGVLFGFPDRRNNRPLYPPLAGGRHCGRIFLEDDGGIYTIERDAGKRGKPRIVLPDGSAGVEADLRRLLGQADATLFESVFAFSLSELQEFGSLEGDGVADRIFSAGSVGAGQPAQMVLEQLEAQAGVLYKPRAKAEINGLLQELDDTERRLREARAAVSGYAALDERLTAARARVAGLQTATEELRVRAERVSVLRALWPTWCDIRVARADLEECCDPIQLEDAQADTLADLEASFPVHKERLASSETLSQAAAQADAALAESLRELGSEWDAAKLALLDTSLTVRDDVAAWSQRLGGAQAAVENARRDLTLAEAARERSAAECRRAIGQQTAEEPPARALLDRRDEALTRLRGLLAAVHMSGTQAPAKPFAPGVRLVFALVAIIALGLAGWSFASGSPAAGAGLTLASVALLVAAFPSRARAVRAFSGSADPAAEADALAWSLGFASLPSFPQIEESLAEVRRQRDTRHAWDDLATRVAQLRADELRAADDAALAATAAEMAAAELDQVLSEWAEWKVQHDVPGRLSPEGVGQFFLLAGTSRDRAQSAARAHSDLAATQAAVAQWEVRAGTLPGAPAKSGEPLAVWFRALADDVRRRRELESTIAQGERTLTLQLGEGAVAAAARRELEGGELEGWRLEAERLTTQLSAAADEHVTAVEERRDIENERRRLQESADVPAIDAEREALVARIDEALRRWRVARLAHGLMADTLDTFVREHQPALLAHATQLFATVTEGRYAQLVHEGVGREIVVLDASGNRKRPADLSRGTAEQLYLCIRLSFAADFARIANLPLVMDDVLVNFDPSRARAMARVLADAAAAHQVLFFTCHPGIRDLLVEAAEGNLVVVDLDTPALAGSSA